jgi:hypothetical protein
VDLVKSGVRVLGGGDCCMSKRERGREGCRPCGDRGGVGVDAEAIVRYS